MAFIGSLYKKPIEIVNYYKIIDSEDYFTEDRNKFLYDRFKSFYDKYLKMSENLEITEKQFKIYLSDNNQAFESFNKFGGWEIIERYKNLADEDKLKVYFNQLKKYALVRQLEKKGFPVNPIVNHPKFEQLTADDIIHAYNHNLNKIMAKLSTEDNVVDITQNAVDVIEQYCTNPALGTPFKWDLYTNHFLGMSKKDLFVQLMPTNYGKSRKSVSLMCDLVFKQNKKVFMIDNEMAISATRDCILTTIANDPSYGFNIGIPERRIKLGDYKSPQEKQKMIEVAKFVETKNDLFYFKELNDFSDNKIEIEIRKMVLGLDAEFIFYGTLKSLGDKQADWSALKTTVTMLKGLANELNVFVYCSAQISMSANNDSIFDLDNDKIGESKGISQIADAVVIDTRLKPSELSSCYIKNSDGATKTLDTNKTYNASKITKNRKGNKAIFVQTCDLDLNYWSQFAYLYKE